GIRWFDAASHGLINLAQKQEERGKAIGLWNYSSPLTPGITQGWRSNLNFDTPDAIRQVKDVLGNFGTGGQPQTLAATSAALNYA
ncbi:VWA domain-containing protein, partial [Corynebacterium belfantii]|nr:VWA domain-containing protein [Corynebacterium belfantii]